MNIPVAVFNFSDVELLAFVIKTYIHFSEKKNTQIQTFL